MGLFYHTFQSVKILVPAYHICTNFQGMQFLQFDKFPDFHGFIFEDHWFLELTLIIINVRG